MNIIDLTNDVCPLALVKLKLALKQQSVGDTLLVLLSDSGSRQDVPAFLKKMDYQYQNVSNNSQIMRLRIVI